MTVSGIDYRVTHRTQYVYAAPVTLSHQRLHLTPRAVPYQQVHSHEIVIAPARAHRFESTDAFGNPLLSVTIESPHTELDVTAISRITVLARHWPDAAATPRWESVRESLAYRVQWQPDDAQYEAAQYLFESPHVRLKRDLRAYCEDCFPAGRSVLQAADALMNKIYRDFRFDPSVTTVNTPVMTFFKQGSGVCQDFAHLMISCLRSMGLASRYMSGYLRTPTTVRDDELVGADASHAWVALFVPGSGWVDLDPTNNIRPAQDHVVLGWGRDFSDVTPLRGVINVGGDQALKVSVIVTPESSTTTKSTTAAHSHTTRS